MKNIANILTLARMVILPLICVLILKSYYLGAVILYALASLTDFADGYVARKYNQITPFGTFLDPIVDKVFVAVILIILSANGTIAGWWLALPALILTREFLISGLREFLGPYNITFPVTKMAKWKTTIQMIALGILIALPLQPFVGLVLLAVATGMTLWTGWIYLKSGLAHIAKMP